MLLLFFELPWVLGECTSSGTSSGFGATLMPLPFRFTLASDICKDSESKELGNLFLKHLECQGIFVAGAPGSGGLFTAVEHSPEIKRNLFSGVS